VAKRTAIIDIGSNSVRMVIFEKTSRFAFHLLHEVKSRVRISEYAYENDGNLQNAAMTRALSALRDFTSIASSYNVRKTLCVATSAVRDAPNRNDFIKRVKQDIGLNIKVIDGEKEAYLGGIACANLLPRTDAVTIDIGGGSTEFAYMQNGGVVENYSLNLGTVRLKELFFDRNNIEGAVAYIDAALEKLPQCDCAHAVGIGGTFRALSRSLLKRSGHPLQKLHGYRFGADVMQAYIDTILDAKDEEQLKDLGVKKERYDVIKPGALILSRVLKHLGAAALTASGVGVREGVFLADLLRHSNHRFPENYNPSMRYLMDRYTIEAQQPQNIAKVAKELFDLLHQKLDIPARYRYELGIAAKLCKIGTALHYYSHHQHSYYLTQTALEYGYTHEQIMLISTLIRFQKRKRPAKSHCQDYESLLPDAKQIEYLSFIISLADALLSHHPRTIDFNLYFDGSTITVESKGTPLYLPIEAVDALQRPKGLRVAFL
jgi:exopolyphosphatase/guanosine-5'-triphosphate,3'-diphosphate pyrophosphatase